MISMRHALVGAAALALCTDLVQGGEAAWAESPKRPVLVEFMRTVTEDHPALKSAKAALEAARARAKAGAQPLYNPEIEVGYEDATDVTKKVGISQTFDWSGKRRARSGVGSAGVEAAQARYEIARKALEADILRAISNDRAAFHLHTVALRRVELSKRFLDLARQRHTAGEMPQSELLTAQLALAEARADANGATVRLSRAEERLSALVGEENAARPHLSGIPDGTARISGTLDPEKLPELRLARSEADVARARIKVAKANRMPDPTVGLRVGKEGRNDLVGLSLSMPVPVRNSYKAEVDAAGADFLQVQQNYYTVNRKVRARYDASLKRYRSIVNAWQTWLGQGAGSLKEQRMLLNRLLEARQIGAIDYLIQLNQTFATETAAIELQGRLWTAWFDWLDASASIDDWLENIQ